MLIPVSHLFIQILQKDYPFYINAHGQFHPTPNHIFNYLLKPSEPKTKDQHPKTHTHTHRSQLQHHIDTPLHIVDPTHAGLALHKWALDTISRQIDILSTQMASYAACKMIISEYDIDDDLFSLETMYRLYFKWKNQTDTTDHTLKLHHYQPPTTKTRDHVIDTTGRILAQHMHLFYTTTNHVATHRIKSICQYMLHHYAGDKQTTIAKIYHTSQASVCKNITTARRFILKHSALRQSINELLAVSS